MTTTTYRAAAFLEAAARLGVPVTVGSERPQALQAANPAGHLTLDFRDRAKATRTVLEFAERHPIGAVLAADDEGVILAAAAAEALRLPHNPVPAVRAARDKHRTREMLAEAGLNCPWYLRVPADRAPAELARQVSFPCVVKPVSLSASRGVIRADDPVGFVAAFRRVSSMQQTQGTGERSHNGTDGELVGSAWEVPRNAGEIPGSPGDILVEGYIPGIELALEGLLVEGELKVLAVYDKPDPLEGPFFEETIYVTPSRLPAAARQEIAAAGARAVRALGLRTGPVHIELRLNDGGPWILEVAPRSIGGLCARTLRFDGGLSLEELILRQALGMDVRSLEREPGAAGVMMIPIARAGLLRDVRGQEEARAVPGIEDLKLTIPLGQEVVPLPEGSRYLGFIFARTARPEDAEAALREAHRRLVFEIVPIGGKGSSPVGGGTSSPASGEASSPERRT